MTGKKSNPQRKHLSKTYIDFHKEYCLEKYAQGFSKEQLIERLAYKAFLEDFFNAIYNKLIYDNAIFHMPYSLGSIYIKAGKIPPEHHQSMRVNYAETARLGRVVKYLNEHTWGYFFKTYWDKTYTHFNNKACYWFRAHGRGRGTFSPSGVQKLSQHIVDLAKDPTKHRFIRI